MTKKSERLHVFDVHITPEGVADDATITMTKQSIMEINAQLAKIPDLEANIAILKASLSGIIASADEIMGEWCCVEYPYLPESLTGFYTIKETAKNALNEIQKEPKDKNGEESK